MDEGGRLNMLTWLLHLTVPFLFAGSCRVKEDNPGSTVLDRSKKLKDNVGKMSRDIKKTKSELNRRHP